VLGHKNPDTDASTSAFALAELFNLEARFPETAEAGILGPLPPQARHVFALAGQSAPEVIEDIRPRVRDVACRQPATLSLDCSLGEALEELIASNRSMLAVVDSEGRLVSVFSHRRDIFKYLLGFSVVPLLGQMLRWRDLCAIPGCHLLQGAPSDERELGRLLCPLAGQELLPDDYGLDDILVCDKLKTWQAMEATRRPRRVIVLSDPEGQQERPDQLLRFCGDLADLFHRLQAQMPLSSLDLGTGSCLGENDEIEDVRELIQQARHALPVLDAERRLLGVVSRSDLEKSVTRKLVLIDHFEASQAVEGLEYADILGIVDHHRVGTLETQRPIFVDCRPVGSSCTIVANRYFEAGLTPSKEIATLLLGGVVSDTLALKSPTTTDTDRRLAKTLAKLAQVDFSDFAMEVIKAGDDLLSADPATIWQRDRKEFTIRNERISIAQLETVALDALCEERLREFRSQLAAHHDQSGELFSLLFFTDVLTGQSLGTAFEREPATGTLSSAFGQDWKHPDFLLMPGVVSRKKQVLPAVLKCLASR